LRRPPAAEDCLDYADLGRLYPGIAAVTGLKSRRV
jgi:hypothetical protein